MDTLDNYDYLTLRADSFPFPLNDNNSEINWYFLLNVLKLGHEHLSGYYRIKNGPAYFSENGCNRMPRWFLWGRWGQRKLPQRCRWSPPLAATLQRAIRERRAKTITYAKHFQWERMAAHTHSVLQTHTSRYSAVISSQAKEEEEEEVEGEEVIISVCKCLACVIILLQNSVIFNLVSFSWGHWALYFGWTQHAIIFAIMLHLWGWRSDLHWNVPLTSSLKQTLVILVTSPRLWPSGFWTNACTCSPSTIKTCLNACSHQSHFYMSSL